MISVIKTSDNIHMGTKASSVISFFVDFLLGVYAWQYVICLSLAK
jgi:hypothetical protein